MDMERKKKGRESKKCVSVRPGQEKIEQKTGNDACLEQRIARK